MMNIGVVVNVRKDEDLKHTKILLDSIKKNGAKYIVSEKIAKNLGLGDNNISEESLIEMSDIIVCLGGDGSFLKTSRMILKRDIPIIGINLGNLGFLADVDKNEIDIAVRKIVTGDYNIEKRMLLETEIIRNNTVIAKDVVLNDVVVSRGALSRILHLRTYVDENFMDMFPGDGLIVSTPTGSTAYSLSAGGPIVQPDAGIIIITPICPHLLYSRSFIATKDKVVKVIVDEDYDHEAMVTVDGQIGYEIRGGDLIITKQSSKVIKMIKINTRNFLEVLRGKIYDRGKKMRRNEV
ncbi:NAD(+)/NADH kinase [Herbivorax sp. ANBcel31]|uniref:NAD(+)/NADH kinase n=1 Tax=Herbivorax sp. ANBcel31 TaxID=3069754 RepID=UPI0027B50ABA|nr:NAD(+)/NADH kinase [Herbivorax sp. ANBcel31]MDQ2086638.1 NAD(+)/NADH kinase [Herbivorax sp. ANBcel31]